MADCPATPAAPSVDPALEALNQLRLALTDVQQLLERMDQRAAWVHEQRLAGKSYVEMVSVREHPLVVELLTQALDELATAGAGWRRAEAKALHNEGLSHERIAELFGVTRQRVSALLASHNPKRRGRSTAEQ